MRSMSRWYRVVGLPAVAVVVLAGCGSSSKSTSSATTPTTAAVTTEAPTTTTPAPAQTITVTPSTGIKDGQAVHIVGKGYTPGKTMGVTECADKGAATGAGDCNLRGIKTAVPDSTGTVTIDFPVLKGPFGSNNIVCGPTQKCLVSVATAGSANPDEVASTDITFA